MKPVLRGPYTVAVCVSILLTTAAAGAAFAAGVPLRDPEGHLGPLLVRLPLLVLILFTVGLIPGVLSRSHRKKLPGRVADVVRREWSLDRVLCVSTGLLTTYVCYISYRNLKHVLPIHREGVLFDAELLRLDMWMFGGVDPATMLHHTLGVGFAAHILSFVYIAYLPLIPITLGVFLVLHRDLAVGAWYATTLILNWVIGTLTYYIVPALGPVYARPDLYDALPETGATQLQDSLLNDRLRFLSNPEGSDAIHGVAAFASLHVAITFAAAYFMHRTGQHLWVRITAWTFCGLTVLSTLYFGWHYIVDDIAGIAVGYLSVTLAAWATGHGFRHRRKTSKTR